MRHIPIVFSASDYFAPYLYVALSSLVAHCKQDIQYDIFILEKDIRAEYKKCFLADFAAPHIKLEFINVSTLTDGKNFRAHDHVSEQTFYKLLIPTLFRRYPKVIFCDSDVLFQADISNLYDIDLQQYKLAASWCVLWNGLMHQNKDLLNYTTEVLGLQQPENYFQGGVLVWNTALVTDQDVDHLLALAQEKSYSCLDQDILNMYFKNDVFILDNKWNYETAQAGFKQAVSYMQPAHKARWDMARQHPGIIHYSGPDKPWLFADEEFASLWWSYARKTVFYELILSRMVEFQTQRTCLRSVLPSTWQYIKTLWERRRCSYLLKQARAERQEHYQHKYAQADEKIKRWEHLYKLKKEL